LNEQKKEEKAKPVPAEPKQQKPVANAPINKEAKKELQKQQKLFQQYEERMLQVKETKKKLEQALSSPEIYSNKEKYAATETEYRKLSEELEKLNADYEKVFEKIVELESQM
jgi:ATP-binding cassette subfamily F protein 3